MDLKFDFISKFEINTFHNKFKNIQKITFKFLITNVQWFHSKQAVLIRTWFNSDGIHVGSFDGIFQLMSIHFKLSEKQLIESVHVQLSSFTLTVVTMSDLIVNSKKIHHITPVQHYISQWNQSFKGIEKRKQKSQINVGKLFQKDEKIDTLKKYIQLFQLNFEQYSDNFNVIQRFRKSNKMRVVTVKLSKVKLSYKSTSNWSMDICFVFIGYYFLWYLHIIISL